MEWFGMATLTPPLSMLYPNPDQDLSESVPHDFEYYLIPWNNAFWPTAVVI